MKRMMLAVLVSGSLAMGMIGGVALAGSDGSRQRSAERPELRKLSGAPTQARTVDQGQAPRIRWSTACRTLRCINNRLNLLKQAVNRINNCSQIVGMSSFGEDPNGGQYGFLWRDDTIPEEFLSTAVDFDPSSTPHVWTMVWVC